MKWLPEWLLTPELDGASVCVVDLCGECGHLCVYKADAQELPSGPDFSHELQKKVMHLCLYVGWQGSAEEHCLGCLLLEIAVGIAF